MTDEKPSDEPQDIPEDAGLAAHPITARRLEKLSEIRSGGGEPYAYRFDRTATAAELHAEYGDLEPGAETGRIVAVAGRVLNVRSFGKLMFPVLLDQTGRIQLFVASNTLGADEFERFGGVDSGDWVGAEGEIITTKKGELSVRVRSWVLLSKSLRPLPEKWHGLKDVERRYRRRYLDLIVSDEARRIALTRSQIIAELRRQFTERGYIEVETPVLQSQAGGALARPFETHHNALDIDMYLRIATELHLKRLVVGGLERVFELGRIFRNEGVDTTHNPEFTTLEAYEAFADYRDIMELVEEVVAAVAEAATGSMQIEYDGRPIDLTPPYRRATLLDLLSEALGESVGFDLSLTELRELALSKGITPDAAWGKGKVITELYEHLVEPDLWEPVFVIDHPKETSPLARVHRRDPNLTERFELFAGGMELCNAFSELIDPLDQRERFEQQAKAKAAGDEEAHPIDEDFIRALEYGMPPTGGLGIGVDRLVMLLTGQSTIREVLLFPHLKPESGSRRPPPDQSSTTTG
ncbi:MAG TPA: lysine--tRNA ligase [Acidimicrobiia bacterium]|nr:lysine--tRNA ligase [Acidimicrobiia bacterium]